MIFFILRWDTKSHASFERANWKGTAPLNPPCSKVESENIRLTRNIFQNVEQDEILDEDFVEYCFSRRGTARCKADFDFWFRFAGCHLFILMFIDNWL